MAGGGGLCSVSVTSMTAGGIHPSGMHSCKLEQNYHSLAVYYDNNLNSPVKKKEKEFTHKSRLNEHNRILS